ncbi:hypothetical protein Q0F98_13365 [Paenibacillus amylolyticus]|nr:hypothetical protein Q0F98_13365 [Paenibacillus amylolyticus]
MSEGRVLQRKRDEGVAIAAVTGPATTLTGSQVAAAPESEIHGQQGQAEKAGSGTGVRGRSIVLSMLPWGAGVMFLALWQLRLFHWIFSLESYQLPVPSAIAISIQENANMLFRYADVQRNGNAGWFPARFLLGALAAAGCVFLSNKRQGGGYSSVCIERRSDRGSCPNYEQLVWRRDLVPYCCCHGDYDGSNGCQPVQRTDFHSAAVQ